jgi:hypothetical protein
MAKVLENLNGAETTAFHNLCETIKNQTALDVSVDQKKIGKAIAEVYDDEDIFLVLDILMYAVGKTPDYIKPGRED